MERSDSVRTFFEAATAAQESADSQTLERIARKLIAVGESGGDKRGLAYGNYFIGVSLFARSSNSAAERAYHKALDLFKELGDRAGTAQVTLSLAAVAQEVDEDVARSLRLYEECLPVLRDLGDRKRLGIALGNLSEIHCLEGEYDRAMRRTDEALAIFRELGELALTAWQLVDKAHLMLLRRKNADAIERMLEAYENLHRDPKPRLVAWYFDVWFIIAAALERWEIAAKLHGFVNRYRDEHDVSRIQTLVLWYSSAIERLSKRNTEEQLDALEAEGEALTFDTAQKMVEGIGA